jgi:nucleoside recognition membrane protein YjiH
MFAMLAMFTQKKHNLQTILTFIVPSLIGLFLFMSPISFQGNMTIPIAIVAQMLLGALGESLPLIVTCMMIFTALITTLEKLFHFKTIKQSEFFNGLNNVSPTWFILRLLGALFASFTYLTIGPEMIFSNNTGALVLNDLLPILFCVFIFAGLLLPLLLNFGLLELFGTLLTKVMRPVFNLPGRSAIDCIASWLGDGSVGILMTSKQYEAKFYTQREAAVIGTTFSAV